MQSLTAHRSARARRARGQGRVGSLRAVQLQWRTPDVITYSACISTCEKADRFEDALYLSERLYDSEHDLDDIAANIDARLVRRAVEEYIRG